MDKIIKIILSVRQYFLFSIRFIFYFSSGHIFIRLPGLARLAIALAKRANPACPAKCGGRGGRGGLAGK